MVTENQFTELGTGLAKIYTGGKLGTGVKYPWCLPCCRQTGNFRV